MTNNVDPKSLTGILPQIIARGDTQAAKDLVCGNMADRNAWLPEALMAFNTPGLSPQQKLEMVGAVFPATDIKNIVEPLAACNARLGRIGFSFPIWRYLTQSFNQASLVEQFGMTKLKRDTDIADPVLPNPARDLFGTGFVSRADQRYIEYRRSYIVCADDQAAIVIRNNSYFFGRDRLPGPVYVSFRPMTGDKLESLTPQDFTDANILTRWQDIIPSAEKISRIETLLETLDDFDMQLNHWLKNDGLKPLGKFLSAVKVPAPFIGLIDKDMPPWFPITSLPVTPELADAVKTGNVQQIPALKQIFNPSGQEKLVLLSGPGGDTPLPQLKP